MTDARAASPIRVTHLLASAQRDWTGIAGMIGHCVAPLSARGYRISALFLDRPGPLVELLSLAGADVHTAPWTRSASDPIGALRVWRFLRANRCDVIHSHVGGRLLLRLARRASRAPVVLHVHSRILETENGFGSAPIDGTDADAVVAVSNAAGAVVHGLRPTVVYPGIPVAPRIEKRPEHGANGRVLVGALGRLERGKAYADLVRAVAQLPREVRLEIAGDGPEREPLETLARELGVADRVSFLGWVTDIEPLLARWTLFAHPSLEESIGTSILQAMAAGLPVVATQVGGVPEAVGEAGVLVPAGRPDALAAAIGRVLDDPHLAASLARSARDRVSQTFSVEREVDALDRLYRSIARR